MPPNYRQEEQCKVEISFESDSLRYFERLYSASFTHEETTEIIVPDALPDVGGVLTVEGLALLRGKEASTDSLTVTGVCDLSVLYLPEEVQACNSDLNSYLIRMLYGK